MTGLGIGHDKGRRMRTGRIFAIWVAAALTIVAARPVPTAAQHEPTAEHAAAEPAAQDGGLPPFLNFDLPLAFWTVVVFVVLLWVLKRFAWGPILGALDAREAAIRNDIEDAERARLEAERLLAEHQKKLDAVQDEVRAILDEARRDAQHTGQQIQREAQEEARAIRDRSRREIEQARDQALKDIWDQAAGLVREASGKVIGRTLTESDHERIIEEALAEFSGQSAQ